jgi:hypothetical protein
VGLCNVFELLEDLLGVLCILLPYILIDIELLIITVSLFPQTFHSLSCFFDLLIQVRRHTYCRRNIGDATTLYMS